VGSAVRKNKVPSFVLLFAVVGVAVVLSVASFSYFQSVSQQIDATVREDLRRQARIEAFQVTPTVTGQDSDRGYQRSDGCSGTSNNKWGT